MDFTKRSRCITSHSNFDWRAKIEIWLLIWNEMKVINKKYYFYSLNIFLSSSFIIFLDHLDHYWSIEFLIFWVWLSHGTLRVVKSLAFTIIFYFFWLSAISRDGWLTGRLARTWPHRTFNRLNRAVCDPIVAWCLLKPYFFMMIAFTWRYR